MQDKAMEFSRLGDELFGGFSAAFVEGRRHRLLVEQPLTPARFDRIRLAAASYLSACLGSRTTVTEEAELLAWLDAARESLPNYSADGLLIPKREQTLEYNALLKSVAAAFGDFDLSDRIKSVDPLICVRVVHGTLDPVRARQPYASSKLHSDVWAGVPLDAVVAVVPLFGDIENVTITFGEMDREREREWMRTLPDYDDGRDVAIALPYRDVALKHGTLYLADGRLLHRTVRRDPAAIRVSLDFRFRLHGGEAYRALAVDGNAGATTGAAMPYARWLALGDETVLAFDETMAAARARGRTASPPGYASGFRPVQLFERYDDDGLYEAAARRGLL